MAILTCFEEATFCATRANTQRIILMSTIISASEVTVRYNEHAVLDDVTLGIQEGDRIDWSANYFGETNKNTPLSALPVQTMRE
jgi:hypothetical protein